MYYVEHLADILCTLYICSSQPNAAQLGFVSSKIDPERDVIEARLNAT